MKRLFSFTLFTFFINHGFCALSLDCLPFDTLDIIAGGLPVQQRLYFYTLDKAMVSYAEHSKGNRQPIGTSYNFSPPLIRGEKLSIFCIESSNKVFELSYKYRIPLNIIVMLKLAPLQLFQKEVKKKKISNFTTFKKTCTKKLNKIFLKNEGNELNSNTTTALTPNFFDSGKCTLPIQSTLDFFDCIKIESTNPPYIESILFEYNHELIENFDNSSGLEFQEEYQKQLNKKFPHLKKVSFQVLPHKPEYEALFSLSLDSILPIMASYFKISTVVSKHLCIDCEKSDYAKVMEVLLPAIPSPELVDLSLGKRFWYGIKDCPDIVSAYERIFQYSPNLKTITYADPKFDAFYMSSIKSQIQTSPFLTIYVKANDAIYSTLDEYSI